ncbi:hypothetical protein DICPUDRAFT_50444 [Dictyostelium purpureum]|uniref:DNA mismatch repair proteins mutS family domain-containing protein n=1 Tax=Dictyostelium purpureum TaxID=5786 RepID=F0ZYF7_DICPU|nr:uncharacterized protein DICPUDRAFT_50444 [Dictyostelium purpureum]EGC31021.1 hypothetical protein DICPUDRAFT_50444 [Dictyostelium purpureum]|eukprot:XP_003292459.1 hypothetical protein DICPUDRAFT_50444 [Dictyostelium purpureum]
MSDNEQEETTQVVLKEDKGFVSFFQGLDLTDKDTIRLFDRKGYYSIHGDDAVFVALMHFKSKKSLKYWGTANEMPKKKIKLDSSSSPPPSNEDTNLGLACLTIRQGFEYEQIIKELFEEKKKIEIWAAKPNRINQWELSKKGSRGNTQQFEDVLFNYTENSVMMALKVTREKGSIVFGIAFGDATFKTLGVSEFMDNDNLSNLSSFIMQMSIKECLLYSDPKNYDYAKVKEKLAEADIPFTEVPKADFSSKNAEQDLTRLLGSVKNNLLDLEKENAIQSASCLIKHLDLLSNPNYFGKFKLEKFDLNKYMKLDSASFRGLHIIDLKEHNSSGLPNSSATSTKDQSLYNLLNQCNTPMGSRLLLQWVKQPLLDTEEIEMRLNFVETFFNDIELRQSLRSNDLKKIGDLDRLSKKLHGQKASLEDCVNLYGIVNRLPVVLSTLNGHSGVHQEMLKANFIDSLESIINDFQKFCAMVEKTIDLDLANEKHEYVIRSSFDEALAEIQKLKDKTSQKIEGFRIKTADKLDLDESKVKLHYSEKDGYLLRISRKDEVKLRDKKEFIIYATQKDGVRFSIKEINNLNETYKKLSAEYANKQDGLAKRTLQIAASFVPLIEDLSSLIATLDVFVTMAHISSIAPTPFVRPEIHPLGTGNTVIFGGRHPCVETQDGVSFIANDIELIREESQFQIITGPNMGGKSTFIRQVGLIVLMAQIGCFVPAQKAIVSVVDCILSRVGAGDSQLRGVSTFMAEMLETSYILKVATKNSLIIIDELGRGTSTYDGFGLAWGIAEYICNQIGGFCLFATHFHELTILADIIPVVKNLHVSASTENNTFTLLYKVESGACDQSFGIHVAVLADFPQQVIETAKLKAKELESFESNTLKQNHNSFLEEFKEIDFNTQNTTESYEIVKSLLSKYSIDIE